VSQPQGPLQTSGTYGFAPSMGSMVMYAFSLCGIRRTALTQSHYEDAKMATNLTMSRWSAKGVNLWQVDAQQVNLVQGQSTYQVPPETIVILDAYVTITSGNAPIDRLIFPVSRSEYASYANKQQQGGVTVFWFDRLLSPTLTLWPVPDGTTSLLTYYRLRQTQDSVMAGGLNLEIPIYFLDAFALSLAWRLAMSWAPEKAGPLKALADEAYNDAINQNVETQSFYVQPSINGYFR
jgi:hypothetical protein